MTRTKRLCLRPTPAYSRRWRSPQQQLGNQRCWFTGWYRSVYRSESHTFIVAFGKTPAEAARRLRQSVYALSFRDRSGANGDCMMVLTAAAKPQEPAESQDGEPWVVIGIDGSPDPGGAAG